MKHIFTDVINIICNSHKAVQAHWQYFKNLLVVMGFKGMLSDPH